MSEKDAIEEDESEEFGGTAGQVVLNYVIWLGAVTAKTNGISGRLYSSRWLAEEVKAKRRNFPNFKMSKRPFSSVCKFS